MLFNTIRIVLWLAISVFVALKIKKSKIVRKKLTFNLTVALCFVLLSLNAMFPVENLFYNFKSPESVFNYTNSGKINEIIYGQKSCMVIYSKWNSTGGHYVIPKSEKGYKIPRYLSTKKVSHKFDKDGSFDVYNVHGTNDYYVVGTVISKENEISIVDSNNKPVKSIVIEMGNTDIKTILLFSFVEKFTSEYYFLINGEKLAISN